MASNSPYPTPSCDPPADPPRPMRWWRRWGYRYTRAAQAHPTAWRRVRHGSLAILLALSGLVILALVRQETGTEGFLVGLGLAVLPVPLLIGAFRWLDRVEPGPWRNVVFAFAWGACAAALIAIVANSFATRWIAIATADPAGADTLGTTVIAPVVEESAKGAAILLLFLFRSRDFTGIVDGVVIAGVTATGFAFTENILYLGTAFGTDQSRGDAGLASVTVATFFVRVVMSPFAHPLFTVLTGIGFGIAAAGGERQRMRRVLLPLSGLLLAMGVHAFWNGSAAFGDHGFFAVYGAFMVPAFALLTWLVIWTRQRELRVVREELPAYVTTGWFSPAEPYALGSMRARRLAREYAGRRLGKQAARAVAEYEAYATSLAVLRRRGSRGRARADFVPRERELLGELWRRRDLAAPALTHAAHATAPPPPVPTPMPVPPWPPYRGDGYGTGHGTGYDGGHSTGHPGPGGAVTPHPAYYNNPYRT
ncbi:PrsW family intramembrane metalloprotease [Streptomyces sp. NPDC056716]|uniref:PrsW family intramembrane metalloprotease n=1 Tax=unclassified Streptomyces TaxID=2593676 RepID=UPI0036C38628